MSESPNYYSTNHLMSASSSFAGGFYPTDSLNFGFPAIGFLVYNSCGDRLYYNLKSGTPTTADAFIAGCSALALNNLPPIGQIGLMTTSTSSTSRPAVAVSAWASA